MADLFGKEVAVLKRAKGVLSSMPDPSADYYKEFLHMTLEYESLLRQSKLLIRCADLNTTGLNSDKLDLLGKVNIDELTNVYNRRFLEENLSRYLNLLAHTKGQLSILMIDLDFFKNYNDTYGHTAGDACLKKVAATLQSSMRRSEDFVARYGGEEFVVVLSGADQEDAMTVANRMRESVQNLQIVHEQNEACPYVTISIGVTSGEQVGAGCHQKYIAQADKALYQSKRTGRNRITFYALDDSEA